MKTIYTSLPIYDRLAKQCYERARAGHSGYDLPVPVVCPRHRLPSFQWLDNGDGATSVSNIELIDRGGDNYNGPTPFTGWTNNGWDVSWESSGLEFTASETSAHIANAEINGILYIDAGELLKFHCVATINVDNLQLYILENGALAGTYNIVSGENNIEHTVLANCTYVGGGLTMYISSDLATAQTVTVSNTDITINSINNYFVTLPASHAITGDTYFAYDGDTLNYLLPAGVYYLKITMDTGHIYYSDWFKVDCVYENLITGWTNNGYDTLTLSNTSIWAASEAGVNGNAYSDSFESFIGEEITVIFFLSLIAGDLPVVTLNDTGDTDPQDENAVEGLNVITFTSTLTTDYEIQFSNATASTWMASEVMVIRSFSTKYLVLNFSNECDLGDILYSEGFDQTVWFESEPMETAFPQEEVGLTNGNGRFVRTFARQVKKYIARTKEMPDFMVEVFNRMKLHDTIELVNLVGDINDVYNLEVSHEWLGDDKYYARIDLNFDLNEVFTIAGCCNNIT